MNNETTAIEWKVPSDGPAQSERSKAALVAAQETLSTFGSRYSIRCSDTEQFMPHLAPSDLTIAEKPVRAIGYYVEYDLQEAKASQNLEIGGSYQFKLTKEDHYSVKFLQLGIIDQAHAKNVAEETILEAKILMNLKVHPSICQIYGICSLAIEESLLTSGRDGYFFISDHIAETLPERMGRWRAGKGYSDDALEITQRLQTAMQVASALVHLEKQNLVCYIRPDKVGFAARDGKVKLFSLGQARELGATDHPESIASSDNISVLAYTAPEIFCGGPANPGIDVFGMAVMLWELFCLERPFDGLDRATHFQKVVLEHVRPETNELWETNSSELLRASWDPFKRTTIEALYNSLESMLLYHDPISELLDVAKTKREKAAKAYDPPSKSDETMSQPLIGSDLCLSVDTLKDLEEILHATASKLKAARQNKPSDTKKSKNKPGNRRRRSQRLGRRDSSQDDCGPSEQVDSKASGSTPGLESSDEVSRIEATSGVDTDISIISSQSILEDSFVASEDWAQEEPEGVSPEPEGQPAVRRGSATRLMCKLVKQLSSRSVKKGLDKAETNLRGRRRSTGTTLADPEGEKASDSQPSMKPRRSMNLTMEQNTSSHHGKTEELRTTIGESSHNPRRTRPRPSRGVRRASSNDKLVSSSHGKLSRSSSPTRSSRMQKQRSSRSVDRWEASGRSHRARERNRFGSGMSAQDFVNEAFSKVESGEQDKDHTGRVVLGVDFRRPPRRSNSSDSMRHRSLSHDDFVRITKEDEEGKAKDNAMEKPLDEGEQPQGPGLFGSLRKMGISSRNIFSGSSHSGMVALEDNAPLE